MSRRFGDFVVSDDDLREARSAFDERSEASKAADRALRGPIPRDVETYAAATRRWDYPGVDTPTDSPRRAFFDFPRPGEEFETEGVAVEEEPRSIREDLDEIGQGNEASFESLGRALRELL